MRTYKFAFSAILAIAVVCAAQHSFATVLSSWSFQAPNVPPVLSDSANGPTINSDAGGIYSATSTIKGVHASAATDWSAPAGNGSANSYSVNTWAIGDYFEIKTSSLSYYDIVLKFDATGSGTGPRDFKIQSSLDGSTFADTGFTYQVLLNGGPAPSWNSTTGSPAYSYSFTFPTAAGVHLKPNLYFRLVDTSTTSVSGATVAAGGTSRIDNVSVEGTLVPEPASLALLFVSMGAMLIRRK